MSAGAVPFGARLAAAVAEHGPLCAGIDPHPGLLRDWGLDDDAAGLERFALACVEALAGAVAAVKPQAAFFERHGSRGLAVLERVVADLRAAGTLCVVDAKRGDVGSTMAAYADAYASDASPLAGDAVTATAYLGWGSLEPLLAAASASGRGVFVLALTSNPEGASVQHARDPGTGRSVAAQLAREAAARNAAEGAGAPGGPALGPVGLVVGATVGDAPARLGIDLAAVRGPLLAPGVGAQGATAADLARVFGAARPAVLASSSREVLRAGPDPAALRAAARRTAEECRAALAA
ncbi:orotidine-5'-phosphate decarboxylase [Quadrisphaera sp. DSM 44207]|uniref:orotidine-5'-phosphate decarboxylase n=1 Tax=Quadrisphaera sp. DSM 44207 TaxID=1881057 RepID=UPI00087F7407|nr:orotidine-5'-phosphate decarboxylase [Quadrisphaera sp. DSM 44207]SDQ46148.1 orotidine-5'-phosphate decarboxylase [Quadrisphaera sp. DSM 44207]